MGRRFAKIIFSSQPTHGSSSVGGSSSQSKSRSKPKPKSNVRSSSISYQSGEPSSKKPGNSHLDDHYDSKIPVLPFVLNEDKFIVALSEALHASSFYNSMLNSDSSSKRSGNRNFSSESYNSTSEMSKNTSGDDQYYQNAVRYTDTFNSTANIEESLESDESDDENDEGEDEDDEIEDEDIGDYEEEEEEIFNKNIVDHSTSDEEMKNNTDGSNDSNGSSSNDNPHQLIQTTSTYSAEKMVPSLTDIMNDCTYENLESIASLLDDESPVHGVTSSSFSETNGTGNEILADSHNQLQCLEPSMDMQSAAPSYNPGLESITTPILQHDELSSRALSNNSSPSQPLVPCSTLSPPSNTSNNPSNAPMPPSFPYLSNTGESVDPIYTNFAIDQNKISYLEPSSNDYNKNSTLTAGLNSVLPEHELDSSYSSTHKVLDDVNHPTFPVFNSSSNLNSTSDILKDQHISISESTAVFSPNVASTSNVTGHSYSSFIQPSKTSASETLLESPVHHPQLETDRQSISPIYQNSPLDCSTPYADFGLNNENQDHSPQDISITNVASSSPLSVQIKMESDPENEFALAVRRFQQVLDDSNSSDHGSFSYNVSGKSDMSSSESNYPMDLDYEEVDKKHIYSNLIEGKGKFAISDDSSDYDSSAWSDDSENIDDIYKNLRIELESLESPEYYRSQIEREYRKYMKSVDKVG